MTAYTGSSAARHFPCRATAMTLALPRLAGIARVILSAALILASLAVSLLSTQSSRAAPDAPAAPPPPVVVLSLNGAVGPASAGYILSGMKRAQKAGAQLIVLEMDTPGGLDLSMREIIQAILASPVPVATYVYPAGARAASAGTYILYASHIAAMAPGTNLGAASPVQIGIGGAPGPGTAPASAPASAPSSEHDTLARKQMQDASAYIRGLAQLRGRNVEWGEKAVRDAVSLSASEAVAQHVADLIAPDLPALLRAVDGKRIDAAGTARVLRTAHAPVQMLAPDWRARFLSVITDPSVALILMMIGVYGLIFEFSTPGMVAPGVIGAICLLLGLFALHMLPVNYAGLALLTLGIGCMVAEVFLPTFGALGVGGIVAFAVGAVMLIDTDVPGFGVPLELIGILCLVSALFVFGMSTLLLRARRAPVVSGADTLLGKMGEMLEDCEDDGWASVGGEQWRVHGAGPLARGQPIRVTGRRGLVLEVIADSPQGATLATSKGISKGTSKGA